MFKKFFEGYVLRDGQKMTEGLKNNQSAESYCHQPPDSTWPVPRDGFKKTTMVLALDQYDHVKKDAAVSKDLSKQLNYGFLSSLLPSRANM